MDLRDGTIIRRFVGHDAGNFVLQSCFGGALQNFVLSGSEGTASHCNGLTTRRKVFDSDYHLLLSQTATSTSGTAIQDRSFTSSLVMAPDPSTPSHGIAAIPECSHQLRTIALFASGAFLHLVACHSERRLGHASRLCHPLFPHLRPRHLRPQFVVAFLSPVPPRHAICFVSTHSSERVAGRGC